MRVLLVGSPAERGRLRARLTAAGIVVVAEFDTLAAAQAGGLPDPIVVAAEAEEEGYEEKLTPRETDVLELLAEGLPNKFIAERLGISDQTVKYHIASIFGKLGASNRTDAVRRALRRGVIHL